MSTDSRIAQSGGDAVEIPPIIGMRLQEYRGSSFDCVKASIERIGKVSEVKNSEHFNATGWIRFVLKVDALRRELFEQLGRPHPHQQVAVYKKYEDGQPWTVQALYINNTRHIIIHLGLKMGGGCSKRVYAVWMAPEGNVLEGKLVALLKTRKPWQDASTKRPDGEYLSIATNKREKVGDERVSEMLDEKLIYEELREAPRVMDVIACANITTYNKQGKHAGENVERYEVLATLCPETLKGLKKSPRLTAAKVKIILGHYLESIRYLHIRGWYHFDIKDDNLYIDAEEQGVLGDFGRSWHYTTPIPNYPKLETIRDGGRDDIPQQDWIDTFRIAYKLNKLDRKLNLSPDSIQLQESKEKCFLKIGKIDVLHMGKVMEGMVDKFPILSPLALKMQKSWDERPTITEVVEEYQALDWVSGVS